MQNLTCIEQGQGGWLSDHVIMKQRGSDEENKRQLSVGVAIGSEKGKRVGENSVLMYS